MFRTVPDGSPRGAPPPRRRSLLAARGPVGGPSRAAALGSRCQGSRCVLFSVHCVYFLRVRGYWSRVLQTRRVGEGSPRGSGGKRPDSVQGGSRRRTLRRQVNKSVFCQFDSCRFSLSLRKGVLGKGKSCVRVSTCCFAVFFLRSKRQSCCTWNKERTNELLGGGLSGSFGRKWPPCAPGRSSLCVCWIVRHSRWYRCTEIICFSEKRKAW